MGIGSDEKGVRDGGIKQTLVAPRLCSINSTNFLTHK